MHLIYEALKKTGGKTDGDSLIEAAKGMKWESPRGPMSIDPETRDVVQTIYIRRVEKVGGEPGNVEFDKVEEVKDPVKARMKKKAVRSRRALDASRRNDKRSGRTRCSTNPCSALARSPWLLPSRPPARSSHRSRSG